MPELMIGAAQVEITPPVGGPLSGYNERREGSTGVHDPLFAKALVARRGDESLAILSLDLVSVELSFTDRVREGIRERLGIPPERVLVAATHTHSGPACFLWPACPPDTPIDAGYVAGLSGKVVGVAEAAAQRMAEGRMGSGAGAVPEVGKNRDELDGPMDPQLGVLYFTDSRGAPLGAVLNYACHPTVMGPDNLLISADFPGYACRAVERGLGPGVVVLYTNGALGDVGTRLVRRSRSFEEAERLGTIVGSEALNTIRKIEETSADVELFGDRRRFLAPPRKFPALSEARQTLDEAERLYEAAVRKGGPPGPIRAAEAWVEGAGELVRTIQERTPRAMTAEVQVLGLGPNLLVGLPGEPFVEIGHRIKERMGPGRTLVLGCANDYLGYILTRQDCEKKVYEAGCNLFAPEFEKLAEDAAEDLAAGLTRP
jgi:hypothetical protein